MRYAEYLFFHFVAVRAGRTAEVGRRTGHIRNQGADEAARTGFSRADRQIPAQGFPPQYVSDCFIVVGYGRPLQAAAHFFSQRRQHGLSLRFRPGPRRNAHFDESRAGVHGNRLLRH